MPGLAGSWKCIKTFFYFIFHSKLYSIKLHAWSLRHVWACLKTPYWTQCLTFLVICPHTKNQWDQWISSRDISDQRILQYDWLRICPSKILENFFSEKWGLYRNRDIHINFCLKMFLAKHNDKFFKIIEKKPFCNYFWPFYAWYTQPYLMENIGLDVVLFWLSVHIQKNNEINEFHPEIYHIPDQRILQYHWLGAFSAITPEKEFQQKWDLYMKKIIHISFSLKMFLTKTNDKNFSK